MLIILYIIMFLSWQTTQMKFSGKKRKDVKFFFNLHQKVKLYGNRRHNKPSNRRFMLIEPIQNSRICDLFFVTD